MDEKKDEIDYDDIHMILTYGKYLVIPSRFARHPKIGLNGSIVLQQIHFWMCVNYAKEHNLPNSLHYHSGRVWVYNSVKDWQKYNFPFWSVSTITRTLKQLEELGVVLSTSIYRFTPKTHPGDRTKWYTIDYNNLGNLFDKSEFSFAENRPEELQSFIFNDE